MTDDDNHDNVFFTKFIDGGFLYQEWVPSLELEHVTVDAEAMIPWFKDVLRDDGLVPSLKFDGDNLCVDIALTEFERSAALRVNLNMIIDAIDDLIDPEDKEEVGRIIATLRKFADTLEESLTWVDENTPQEKTA